MNLLPHVYDQIVIRGRVIIDYRDGYKLVEGDQILLREWALVFDTPAAYKYVAGYTGRSHLCRVISFLPPRQSGYTTALVRLVNENTLYARIKARASAIAHSLRSFALPRRG